MTKLVIQMDEPESFDPKKDSTLALGRAAQNRGYEIYYYTPQHIAALNGEIVANVRPITFNSDDDHFFIRGQMQRMNLEHADVILIRQNPPYNMDYLGCTWLLEHLKHPRVLNNPAAIRNRPEKIFPLTYNRYIPPTCISADINILRDFRLTHGDVVLKPLYGFGGDSIYHIKAEDSSFEGRITSLQPTLNTPVILQPFLPEVMTQEKRIMLINGSVAASFNRQPMQGDFRSNMAVGGSFHETELTPTQLEIAYEIGAQCHKEGLFFVGLDVIGDYLIEINVTCPTGIMAVKSLYGLDLAESFWNAFESC